MWLLQLEATGAKASLHISTWITHLIATISSQVIGCVIKRWSLPRRTLRSWHTLPGRGFRRAEAWGSADFSSSYRRRQRNIITFDGGQIAGAFWLHSYDARPTGHTVTRDLQLQLPPVSTEKQANYNTAAAVVNGYTAAVKTSPSTLWIKACRNRNVWIEIKQ